MATDRALDLTRPPFAAHEADWASADDYAACQALATAARGANTALIRTLSARAAGRHCNVVVLDPLAFQAHAPVIHKIWHFPPSKRAAVRAGRLSIVRAARIYGQPI